MSQFQFTWNGRFIRVSFGAHGAVVAGLHAGANDDGEKVSGNHTRVEYARNTNVIVCSVRERHLGGKYEHYLIKRRTNGRSTWPPG